MSAYLGRRAFDELRQTFSDRDLEVLCSVSRHRFLTAVQIEALHFDRHSTPTAAARVCRRVLARLTSERVLKRLERRVGGVRAGSASYIYAVGPIGARLLEKPQRATEPSQLFLDHTLAIGDVHIQLHRAERTNTISVAELEIEPTCWRQFIGPGGARDTVKPDLYLVTTAGEYEDSWFLEVDRSTESPAAISRKCHAYDRYWRTGQEQQRHGAFPLVVWICPNERRATRIQHVIDTARNLKRELFRVTSGPEFVALVAGGPS